MSTGFLLVPFIFQVPATNVRSIQIRTVLSLKNTVRNIGKNILFFRKDVTSINPIPDKHPNIFYEYKINVTIGTKIFCVK